MVYNDKGGKQLPDLAIGQLVRMKPKTTLEKKLLYELAWEILESALSKLTTYNTAKTADLRATNEPYGANADPFPNSNFLCDAPSVTLNEKPKLRGNNVQNRTPQKSSGPSTVTTNSAIWKTSTHVNRLSKKLEHNDVDVK